MKMGKNKMIKVLVIGTVVLAILIGGYYIFKKMKDNVLDGPGMENSVSFLAIEYSKSADEYGRSTSISVNGNTIKYYYNGGTVEDSFTKECGYDEDFVLQMETVIREYEVRNWANLEKSDLEILDGSTSSMKITFADNLVVCLGDDYNMPDGAWEAVAKMTDLLKSYIEKNAIEVGKEITPADDSGLKLLVDYCEKTTGTNDGDGYQEIVLYKNESDGTYQLHTYSKQGSETELHHAYMANEKIKDEVFELINQFNLVNYKDQQGVGLEGKEYVVKFLQGEDLVRISTDNLPETGRDMLSSIGDFLYGVLEDDNNSSDNE